MYKLEDEIKTTITMVKFSTDTLPNFNRMLDSIRHLTSSELRVKRVNLLKLLKLTSVPKTKYTVDNEFNEVFTYKELNDSHDAFRSILGVVNHLIERKNTLDVSEVC
jgi:hypothetical protein